MITYTVRKNKRTRFTFRLVGIFIMLVTLSQIILFILGYGRKHIFGTILCGILLIYGIYLMFHSFRKTAYDITYEFGDEELSIRHHRGKSVYTYDQVTDVSLVVPENEMIYSIIHLVIGKEDYVIPFSYKKEFCDKVYAFLNERVTAKQVQEETDDSL